MMMQHRGADQLLLPVNPLFLWFSLFAALVFNMLPLGRIAATRPNGNMLNTSAANSVNQRNRGLTGSSNWSAPRVIIISGFP